MNHEEVIRIAVRASMAALGAVLACMMAIFVMAAAMSSDIDIPGVRMSDVIETRSGD